MEPKILKVEGEPRERGLIIGEKLKPLLNKSLIEVMSALQEAADLENPEKLLKRLIRGSKLKKAVKKWTPDLWEEFEAIAESSEIDVNLLFALQCQDEIGVYLQAFGIDLEDDHCSAFGITKTDAIPTIVAQNYDWQDYHSEDDVVILHIKYPNSSFETMIPTILGIRHMCGINNQSIGVCVNAIWYNLNNSTQGLPVPYVTRGLIEQPTLEKAIDFMQTVHHASGYAYMVGDSEKVVNYECSANKVVRYIPSINPERIYHTNHPLVSDDLLPERSPLVSNNTHQRYGMLEDFFENPSKVIDINAAKEILSKEPVCAIGNPDSGAFASYTIVSVINELRDKDPILHLTLGPPCKSEYKKLSF